MNKIICFLSLAFISSLTFSDTIDNAYGLCDVFDSTGLTSGPCKVRGGKQSVDVSIDTNSREANKICNQVAGLSRKQGLVFDRNWRINIYSPFSGSNTIASCLLPN